MTRILQITIRISLHWNTFKNSSSNIGIFYALFSHQNIVGVLLFSGPINNTYKSCKKNLMTFYYCVVAVTAVANVEKPHLMKYVYTFLVKLRTSHAIEWHHWNTNLIEFQWKQPPGMWSSYAISLHICMHMNGARCWNFN